MEIETSLREREREREREMIREIVEGCVYEEPLSIYKKGFYAVAFLMLVGLGISEVFGKHLNYSKFWNSGSKKPTETNLVSSKTGMLLFYSPALFACLLSFWLYPNAEFRFMLLKTALTIHFLKRDLEVLFLHKFSGFIVRDTVIIISTSYGVVAASMLYFHNQVEGIPEPSIDLKYIGLSLYVIGIFGNLYHHYLLSKLRGKDEKGYKIPQGGLFSLVICPHYLFEIITFIGFSFISQTIFSYLTAIGSAFYLFTRSRASRNWYVSKFEDFPKNVKALIPYVY